MWLANWRHYWQCYVLRKQCAIFKSKLKTLKPLDFPRAYLDMISAGEAPAVDRQRRISTTIASVDEITAWVNAAVYDLEAQTMSNRLPPPGTTGKERDTRIDKVLYHATKNRYVDMQYLCKELTDAYAVIASVLADRNHPSHYRAKDKIMPHIERLHEFYLSIVN